MGGKAGGGWAGGRAGGRVLEPLPCLTHPAHGAVISFSRSAGGPYETPMGLPYETPMKPL